MDGFAEFVVGDAPSPSVHARLAVARPVQVRGGALPERGLCLPVSAPEADIQAYIRRAAQQRRFFCVSAAKSVARTSLTAFEVPAPGRQPTFASLTPSQREWYFRWRSLQRDGAGPVTSLGYVTLHAAELIHLIGVDSVEDAFVRLRALWLAHRGAHPSLDATLPRWCLDLVGHYGDASARLLAASAALRGRVDVNFGVDAWVRGEERALPAQAWGALVTHRPGRAAFGRGADSAVRAEIVQAMRLSVRLIDDHWRRAHGLSVAEALAPEGEVTVYRMSFREANFEGVRQTYEVGRVRNYAASAQLSEVLTAFARLGENAVRRRHGKSLLKMDYEGEAVDRVDADLLEAFPVLVTRGKKRVGVPEVAPTPQSAPLRLDWARVAAIEAESGALRERLVREMADGETQALSPALPSPGPSAPPASALSPASGQVEPALEGAPDPARVFAAALLRAPGASAPLATLPVPEGVFAGTLVDAVNDAALEEMGDLALFLEDGEVTVSSEARPFLMTFAAGDV